MKKAEDIGNFRSGSLSKHKLALIGVVLVGLVLLVPATTFGQNQTTSGADGFKDYFMSIPGVVGVGTGKKNSIIVYLEDESALDSLPPMFEGRKVVPKVVGPVTAEPARECTEESFGLKTDKSTYRPGETVVITGRHGLDYQEEFDDPQYADIVQLEIYPPTPNAEYKELNAQKKLTADGCAYEFTYEFVVPEPFTAEDGEVIDGPGTWSVIIAFGFPGAYDEVRPDLTFEVVDENIIVIPEEPKAPDQEFPPDIEITGPNAEECRGMIMDAFGELYTPENDPDNKEYYEFVTNWTDTIYCADHNKWGLAWNFNYTPDCDLETRFMCDGTIGFAEKNFAEGNPWNVNAKVIAGVLVHEAYHEYQCHDEESCNHWYKVNEDFGKEHCPDKIGTIDDCSNNVFEAHAGLYQTKAVNAMNWNDDFETAQEFCFYRVESLSRLMRMEWDHLKEDHYMTICGAVPTYKQNVAIANEISTNSTLQEYLTNTTAPHTIEPIPDSSSINATESGLQEQQELPENVTKAEEIEGNWFSKLWAWLQGMINSVLGDRN